MTYKYKYNVTLSIVENDLRNMSREVHDTEISSVFIRELFVRLRSQLPSSFILYFVSLVKVVDYNGFP